MCKLCKEAYHEDLLRDPQFFGYDEDEIPSDWENDDYAYEWGYDNCDHPRCDCVPPDSELNSYIQYRPQGVLNSELHALCQREISGFAAQEPIDWHPGSNQQVRDLIHPSMYCYVKGVSKHVDGATSPACEESLQYQWLPTEFQIGDRVQATSYINNLDHVKYPQILSLIEQVFEKFVPSLETVLKRPVRGGSLQVIVKIGNIMLTPEEPHYPGGSWHIEGMPYEHIGATCIHYVDVKGITPSFLEFRKPTLINEENLDYPQSDGLYTTHHYGIESHYDGVMNRYLGLIRCDEGASVVFPNTLQHRVKEFSLLPGETSSLRTILAFFVIDPQHRIVSTKDVPPQQGLFSQSEAEHHRERLMVHRKYFINQLNEIVFERPFSLCEH